MDLILTGIPLWQVVVARWTISQRTVEDVNVHAMTIHYYISVKIETDFYFLLTVHFRVP